MNNPNRITLVVHTLSGDFSDDFNLHQTLQHVVDAALKALHIAPRENEQWVLKYGDAQLMLRQTIQDAGLPDGAELQYAPVEGGGGKWMWK